MSPSHLHSTCKPRLESVGFDCMSMVQCGSAQGRPLKAALCQHCGHCSCLISCESPAVPEDLHRSPHICKLSASQKSICWLQDRVSVVQCKAALGRPLQAALCRDCGCKISCTSPAAPEDMQRFPSHLHSTCKSESVCQIQARTVSGQVRGYAGASPSMMRFAKTAAFAAERCGMCTSGCIREFAKVSFTSAYYLQAKGRDLPVTTKRCNVYNTCLSGCMQ